MQSNEAEVMAVGPDATLASVALRGDVYAALLDRHGFDFCRGGARTLSEACTARGVELPALLSEIASASQHDASGAPVDWNQRPLGQLIDFVVERHHAFTRSSIARLSRLLPKVLAKHGAQYPQLEAVSALFGELAMDMEPHMLREERILFPFIRALELPGALATPPFGTVRNPVRMMTREHGHAEELLSALRDATNDFQPPSEACTAVKTGYAALAALRIDLLAHMALENDVLFPRAMELELRKSRTAQT